MIGRDWAPGEIERLALVRFPGDIDRLFPDRSRKSVKMKRQRLGLATGQPMAHADDVQSRFWSKVEKSDGCWLWIAGTSGTPGWRYGQFNIDSGHRGQAHRVSWSWANGRPVPDGMMVLHSCDVTLCVRPDHLFLGTAKVNADDRQAKGRGADLRGEKSGSAVLTAEIVLAIRSAYAGGRVTQQELADAHGISQIHVSQIVRRKRWGHV